MSHPQEVSPAPRLPRSLRLWLVTAVGVLLTFAVMWVLVRVGGIIAAFVVPVILGLLLAALLMPLQVLLNHRLRLPRYLAALVCLLLMTSVVLGIFYFAARTVLTGWDGVRESLFQSLAQIETWLVEGPLELQQDVFDDVFASLREWLLSHTGRISSGVIDASSAVTAIFIAALLLVMTTFFILAEGDRLLSVTLLLFSNPFRSKLRESLRRGWVTLSTWARTQVVVSAVDATGIGLGAFFLGLPFVIPMSLFTFLVCFIPMLGPIVSGAVFVAVALVFKGFGAAVIMLIIVIAVQQVESYLLQPVLMGKAVNLHPLVVLVGVTAGNYLAGIPGALLIVPFMATLNSALLYWHGRDPFPGLDHGGSALRDSPRKLAPSTSLAKAPHDVGGVTPRWLELEHRRVAEAPPRG